MTKINLLESQRNRTGTASFVNFIMTSTVVHRMSLSLHILFGAMQNHKGKRELFSRIICPLSNRGFNYSLVINTFSGNTIELFYVNGE